VVIILQVAPIQKKIGFYERIFVVDENKLHLFSESANFLSVQFLNKFLSVT